MEKKTMPTVEPLTAARINVSDDALGIVLRDGRELFVPWQACSPKLATARQDERLRAELSPGGYGIHWPLLDEDLSIAGLVRIQDNAIVSADH